MRVYRALEEVPPHPAGSCVALGVFDGVHRGHREVLRAAVQRAREDGWRSVALTFHPHPQQVIGRAPESFLILPLEERLRRIGTLGLDAALVLRFDDRLRNTEPEEFVQRVLVEGLGARAVVCGPDFRFGRDRRGDPQLLEEEGRRWGFAVEVCPPVVADGERVSSSRIRALLREGRVEEACELLAHPEAVACVVQAGRVLAVEASGELHLPKAAVLPEEGPEQALARALAEAAEVGETPQARLLARLPVPETLEVWYAYVLQTNPAKLTPQGRWVTPEERALAAPYRRVVDLALRQPGICR